MLLLSITRFRWTQKAPSILLHRANHTYMSLSRPLVILLLQILSNPITLKLLSSHFFIDSLTNLSHLNTLSLIVDMLKLIWHNSGLLWDFVTLLELLTSPGRMDSLKFEIKTLVLISVSSFKTPQKAGLTRSTCTHMHIICNIFQL